jgi:uncharacterized protein YggE
MRSLSLIPFLAVLAACGSSGPRPRVDHDETLLTVTATGTADTRPDEARLQLGVQSNAASAGEASRANRDKMARVTAALAALGVKPDDLQTRNLSLARIDYGPERGRFRADNVLQVRLRDTARVSEAVTAATEAGANVLSGPDLRISDREASSRSAYAAAYRAARARAEAYAEAAGLKIGRVLTIQDGGEGGMPIPYAGMDARAQSIAVESSAPPPPVAPSPPPTPFNPGVSTQQVAVRVDFALARR